MFFSENHQTCDLIGMPLIPVYGGALLPDHDGFLYPSLNQVCSLSTILPPSQII